MKKKYTTQNILLQKVFGIIVCLFCFMQYTQAQDYILIDVALKQEPSGNCMQTAGSEAIFKVKVFRQDSSLQKLNNIIVKDSLDDDLSFLSASVSSGYYDSSTGIWSNIQLMVGDTATLIVRAKIKSNYQGGILSHYAWIKSIDTGFIDLDSVPGNQKKSEDDYDTSSVSIPISICASRNEKVELSAPKGFSTYQWFRNGVPIDNAVDDVLIANSIGEYSITIDAASKCISYSCCPIYVEEKCYCPPTICLPILVNLTKSRN